MTALTKQLTNAELRQIIDSHEKGHGMCVPVNYGYIAAKELLAVREAQSVPVGFRSRLGEHGTWHFNGWRDPDAAEKEHCEIEMLYTAPPALPDNVRGRPATPDDSPYPATISGGCLLAQAWADGYNVRNAVTAAPAPAVPDAKPEIDYGEGGSDIDYMQPQEIYDMGKVDGCNAYRTEMLAAAPTPTK